MIVARDLQYRLRDKREILNGISFNLNKGEFLAVLGENGAGKTTLLDLLMGFRRRSGGELNVMERDPDRDPWQARSRIGYLSEKIDIPGDWDGAEFLSFHRRFYDSYDLSRERVLVEQFTVRYEDRVGNLSAGEIRRLQIIGALATGPELLIVDEITAVLDILGRRKFLKALQEQQKERGMTVVLATNIPEGLETYADKILLINRGRQILFSETADFLNGSGDLAGAVAEQLEHL